MARKNQILTGLATLAVTTALGGLFFVYRGNDVYEENVTFVTAAAENSGAEISAEGTAKQSGFRMKEGASIRLNNKTDAYGIRFGAVVEDETQSYTMMIVPTELAAGYDEASGKTLSEYCESRAASAGGSVAKAEGLVADENKEITCALVRVKWENLNRDFTAIAYYEATDGSRIEAARAEEGERSVAEVARLALKAGALNDDERAAVERLKTDGEKEADGVVLDTGVTEELFDVAAIGDSDCVAVGENKDKWYFYGGSEVEVRIGPAVLKRRLRYDSGTTCFSLTAKTYTATASFQTAAGETVLSVPLKKGVQTEVRLATELLKTCTAAVFTTKDKLSETDGEATYIMGEIREQTAEKAAADMHKRIENLKDMQAACGADGGVSEENDGQYGAFVSELQLVKQSYDYGLSAAAKNKVDNSADLARLWNEEFDNKTLLISPDVRKNKGYVTKGLQNTYGENMQTDVIADESFGNVWAVTRGISFDRFGEPVSHDSSGYSYKTEIRFGTVKAIEDDTTLTDEEKFALEKSEKESLTAGYSYIKFYVFISHNLTENEELALYFTKPEERYSPNSATQDRLKIYPDEDKNKLTIGAWNEITLTREQFIKYGRITAMFALLAEGDNGDAGMMKISAFYGVK